MIRYCPDPQCPARRRTGHAAEYGPGVDRCNDCGAPLAAENPTGQVARTPWPVPLRHRLNVTIGLAVLALLAGLVPSPWIDLEAATGLMGSTWARLNPQLGPFALGLLPVLTSFVLVELAALVVPRWNRRRHGDPGFRQTLLVRALTVGFVLALVQGYFLATYLESVGHAYPHYAYGYELTLVREPGLAFRLLYAVTAATGTLLLALGALVISRYGVGNGFAVLLLVDLLRVVPTWLYDLLRELLHLRGTSPGVLLLGLALFAWLPASIALVFTRQPRPTRSALPLVAPTSGILPLELAMPLVIPTTLLAFVDLPWLRVVADATQPGTVSHLLIQLGLILVFVPVGSWLYWWRFRGRLRQPGHAMAWLGAQCWTAALLATLVLLWYGVSRQIHPQAAARMPLIWLIPVVVLLIDLVTEVRARRHAPGGADLVPLAEYQHPAEALEDSHRRPAEAGAFVQGLRFRTLHYFFAPQVPCRVLGVATAEPTDAAARDTGFAMRVLHGPPRIRRDTGVR